MPHPSTHRHFCLLLSLSLALVNLPKPTQVDPSLPKSAQGARAAHGPHGILLPMECHNPILLRLLGCPLICILPLRLPTSLTSPPSPSTSTPTSPLPLLLLPPLLPPLLLLSTA
ncbi:hypothetical protein B0J11DRAFT_250638 [Dendryphion nanum]|uniref:Uncharacterized protein n=1 Tax=Dendryphion nanum TaxID=256645 RepID=A0A9P9E478_9PLEO|nr:hypothetical protein B0J11DRAFT_250638 [Dendryphion nanum]